MCTLYEYTYRAIPTVDVRCARGIRLKWVDGKLNVILYCLLDFWTVAVALHRITVHMFVYLLNRIITKN